MSLGSGRNNIGRGIFLVRRRIIHEEVSVEIFIVCVEIYGNILVWRQSRLRHDFPCVRLEKTIEA